MVTQDHDAGVVRLNRDTGAIEAPNLRALLHSRLVIATTRALAPIGYLGVSRLHAALHRAMLPTTITVIDEKASSFAFPSSDYYWSRLLDRNFTYEPEIAYTLERTRGLGAIFVDLGANFGYWTVRIASGIYGQRRVVAVEPCESSFEILRKNLAPYPNVSLYRAAIDERSGAEVRLFGSRHAGMSVDPDWFGASDHIAATAKTITIDHLVSGEGIDVVTTPVIIKLDVEGAELRALRGAVETLKGATAIIMEDAEPEGVSEATRFCFSIPQAKVFLLQASAHRQIRSIADVASSKGVANRIQGRPVHILVTCSPIWMNALANT